MTNRMREICTSGSVGALGGNPPQGDPAAEREAGAAGTTETDEVVDGMRTKCSPLSSQRSQRLIMSRWNSLGAEREQRGGDCEERARWRVICRTADRMRKSRS